ncbi:MAG: hypothetical protein V3U29_00575 [Phycisphaeraceae bacterium]
MKPTIIQVNRLLLVAAGAMGVASFTILNDADKSPIYFLLAYVLWRLT